jgi:hypothetical protein
VNLFRNAPPGLSPPGTPDPYVQVGQPGVALCLTGSAASPGSLLVSCAQETGTWYKRPRYIALMSMAAAIVGALVCCQACRCYHGVLQQSAPGGTLADEELEQHISLAPGTGPAAVGSNGYGRL